MAGFVSECMAGFMLEFMAGFVGIPTDDIICYCKRSLCHGNGRMQIPI
jgi:hypothetical protein